MKASRLAIDVLSAAEPCPLRSRCIGRGIDAEPIDLHEGGQRSIGSSCIKP